MMDDRARAFMARMDEAGTLLSSAPSQKKRLGETPRRNCSNTFARWS